MIFLQKNPALASYVKDFKDEENGFTLSTDPEINSIQEGVKDDNHSMCSFAFSLRACQAILLGTHQLAYFMPKYDETIAAKKIAKEADEEVLAHLEDEDKDKDEEEDEEKNMYIDEWALVDHIERQKQAFLERQESEEYTYYHHESYSYYS